MTTVDQVEQRLAAVERTVVDGDHDWDKLSDAAAVVGRLEDLESQIQDLEQRIAVLEGRSESFESYIGNVDTVNENVEQRADMAIASVDRLERQLVEIEQIMEISTMKQIDHRMTEIEDQLEQLSAQGTSEGEAGFQGVSFGETDDEGEQSAESANNTAVDANGSVRNPDEQSTENGDGGAPKATTEASEDQQEHQSSETAESPETEQKKSLRQKLKSWKRI